MILGFLIIFVPIWAVCVIYSLGKFFAFASTVHQGWDQWAACIFVCLTGPLIAITLILGKDNHEGWTLHPFRDMKIRQVEEKLDRI